MADHEDISTKESTAQKYSTEKMKKNFLTVPDIENQGTLASMSDVFSP
jgi:hypothetical protein